jgi:hypothetical protein
MHWIQRQLAAVAKDQVDLEAAHDDLLGINSSGKHDDET